MSRCQVSWVGPLGPGSVTVFCVGTFLCVTVSRVSRFLGVTLELCHAQCADVTRDTRNAVTPDTRNTRDTVTRNIHPRKHRRDTDLVHTKTVTP